MAKRVILITEYFYPDMSGSTPEILSNLFQSISKNRDDLQIDVITSDNFYRNEKKHLSLYEEWEGLKITRVQTPKTRSGNIIFRFLSALRFSFAAFLETNRKPCDYVVITSNPPTTPLITVFLRIFGKRPQVLYIIHDLHPDSAIRSNSLGKQSILYFFSKLFQKIFLLFSDHILVLGRCMKNYIHEKYKIPLGKITVTPNWSPIRYEEPVILSNFSLFRIAYIGNIGSSQDFSGFFELADNLKNDPRIIFIIAGDGEKADSISKITNSSKNIYFNRRTFSKDHYFRVLETIHLPFICLDRKSLGVAVPSKIYDFIACGKPVLFWGPSECEAARLIKDQGLGLIIDPQKPEASAKEILEIVESDQKYALMAKKAFACSLKCSMENTASIISKMLD